MGPTTGQRRSFLTANNLPDTWVPESGCFGGSKLPLPVPIAGNPTQLGTGWEGIPVLTVPIRLTGLARVTDQTLKNLQNPLESHPGVPIRYLAIENVSSKLFAGQQGLWGGGAAPSRVVLWLPKWGV